MTTPRHATLATLLTATLLATPALASPPSPADTTTPQATQTRTVSDQAGRAISVGARIGGYGFRRLNEQESLAWDSCRMDGLGVTAAVDWTPHLFTEASIDAYFAREATMRQGIDRLSMLASVTAGARLVPDFFIVPNIHIGLGAEWTKVEVFGVRDSGLFPLAYLGVGGELNIRKFRLGMNIRANAMQLPTYDWQDTAKGVQYETELSGQALFTMRYML